ncbi:MAG: glutamate--tRNA ligase [Halobacteriovorax sp.]|nr:glutamate--tRNA ligase [Halobacteriovorax sp.]|tara:strand:- start:109276 stop:110700 length:1425 start_codon:yes stop_codon:yes gene_type:complete
MTVRVRYAPSPTGHQHIGGARTALYDLIFAKSQGGTFVLRVEDTDQERSKREYEDSLLEDFKWLGLEFDEGPHKPGAHGPYRQSERIELYKELAWKLVEEGKAYPCFLTSEELEKLTAEAEAEKKAPHTYHGKYRNLDPAEAKAKVDGGAEYVIRFKNPQKEVSFTDMVRGEVKFYPDMVGDFVILRANGYPVYNFCCVVDDWKMEITHAFRSEEHLNNSLRQLLLYEAFDAKPPVFAHLSMLVGEDRKKLSKRHGATSVRQYKDQHYLPAALLNYLCLLGWSHPEETDIFDVYELEKGFDASRFNKSPALYDIQKLKFFNEQHLRALPEDKLLEHALEALPAESKFRTQDSDWQNKCLGVFKEKIQLITELDEMTSVLFNEGTSDSEDYKEAMSWETTPQIQAYLKGELESLEGDFVSEEKVGEWMNYLKKELKIKGKPLFMGARACLTGQVHGPDLKGIVALTPKTVLLSRF